MCAHLIGLAFLYFCQNHGKRVLRVASASQALVLGCDSWSRHPTCPTGMVARNKFLCLNATVIIVVFYYTEFLCQLLTRVE